MKIKLKKFSIIKPNIKVEAGFRTISRGGPSGGGYNNYAVNIFGIINTAGTTIVGNFEVLED